MKTIWIRWAAALCACLGAGLNASAQAQVHCDAGTFAGGSVNFGAGRLTPNHNDDGNTVLTLRCTNDNARPMKLRVCLGLGGGTGGSTEGMRQIVLGSDRLNYQLYTDPGRTKPLEDWPSHHGAVFVSLPPHATTPVSIPIYGRLFGGQTALETGLYVSQMHSGTHVHLRWEATEEQSPAPDCSGLTTPRSAGNVGVRFEAIKYCTLTITSHINFGAVSSLKDAAMTATGSLAATCSNGTDYTIAMGDGLYASGAQQRRMRHAHQNDQTIAYALHRDSNHQYVWGADIANRLSGQGTGSAQTHAIYARVPAGQATPVPGLYQDTVVVTLYY